MVAVVEVNNNGDDGSVSPLNPVSNTAVLSNTREEDIKGQRVGLKLVILIEKRTHVKGRKNVLLRKIKWLKMTFEWNQCTSWRQYAHPKL